MKKIILTTILTGTLTLQYVFSVDTLKVYPIEEVSISKSLNGFYSEDRSLYIIDSTLKSNFNHSDLGQLLIYTMPVNIRQYGAEGGLSMISVHGLKTSHTQVNWNGFPINSMTTGDSDLSMVPTGFIDQVSLVTGAPGSLYGSGTLGGVIQLENIPDFQTRFNSSLYYEKGSFGSNKYGYTLKTGNNWIQYHLAINQNRAKNNFKYIDYILPNSPEITIKNNEYTSKGIVQHIFMKLPGNNKLNAGIWLQSKDKEIPDVMGKIAHSYAAQNDIAKKAFISYSKLFHTSSLNIKTAYFDDYLRYRYKQSEFQETFNIDNTYQIKKVIADASYRHYFNNSLTFDIAAIFQHAEADVGNYGGKVNEKRISVVSAAKYKIQKTIINISLREEFVDNRKPQLLVSAGLNQNLASWITLKSSIFNKYRTPTFNERYWKPGGNPDLAPEKGISGEFNIENIFHLYSHNLSLNHTIFYSKVENLVEWITDSIIRPVSQKEVIASGYDLNSIYSFRKGKLNIKFLVNYVFSISRLSDHYTRESYIGNHLIYSPIHTLNSSFYIDFKSFFIGMNTILFGKQYTTEDNNEIYSISPYSVSNFNIGYNMKISGINSSLNFQIKNLFNTSYEMIRSYPMPGRTYYISLNIGFNKL